MTGGRKKGVGPQTPFRPKVKKGPKENLESKTEDDSCATLKNGWKKSEFQLPRRPRLKGGRNESLGVAGREGQLWRKKEEKGLWRKQT